MTTAITDRKNHTTRMRQSQGLSFSGHKVDSFVFS